MRYLILFMVLVGVFVLGGRSCFHGNFNFGGGIRGEGPVKTETRDLRDFHALESAVPATVEVRVADQYQVEIQGQENILAALKTEVRDGKLHVYFEENVSQTKDLLLRIAAPAFDDLGLAGSGNMKVLTPLHSERLALSVGGSGEIHLPQADAGSLNCSIAGSGSINVGGKAGDAQFEIAGSGDVEAKELLANTGKADIAGSGSVTCNVAQTLKASIAGSGDVFYLGTPSVDADVSGSGKVKKLE